MKRVVHAACPHDCPDACGVLITIEDGRATRIQGDPEHPVTRGFLCAKVAKYLDRVYSPDRVLYPMRRVGPKGPCGDGRPRPPSGAQLRSFRAHLLGRGSRRNYASLAPDHRRIRPRIHPALLLRRHARRAQRRFHGPPFLPPPGRFATGAQHLLHRRRRRPEIGDWHQARHRAGTVCAFALHHRLGLEHSRQQRSSLALHRRSSPQRREAGRHRSLPHAHREVRRLVPADQSRHRCRARSRPDARHHQRKSFRRRLRLALHRGVRRPEGSRATVSAGESCPLDRHIRRRYPQAGPRVRHRAAVRDPRQLRHPALRARRHVDARGHHASLFDRIVERNRRRTPALAQRLFRFEQAKRSKCPS